MKPTTLTPEERLELLSAAMLAKSDRRWGLHYFGMAFWPLVAGRDNVTLEFESPRNAYSTRTMFYAYRADLQRNNSGAPFLDYLYTLYLQTEGSYITVACKEPEPTEDAV